MKSRVIKGVAAVLGVAFFSAFPARAQQEEETTIEFAPDDEPDSTGTEPSGQAKKPSGSAQPAPLTQLPADGWGPPAPIRPVREYSLATEMRPSTAPKPGAKVFGRYRVRVGAANPVFNDNLKFYKDLYGSPSIYPVIAADWFAWDWYVTFGLSLRTGVYTAEGKAAKVTGNSQDITSDTLTKDDTSSTTLTLIPSQLTLAAEFTPFPQKWIVFDGWVGAERLYFQETRTGAKVKTGQSYMTPLAVTSGDDALTNNGFKTSRVTGVAVNFLLNALDEQSTQSMRSSMGLASIYLSPYIEIVQQSSTGVDFSRVNRGITFTFESVY